MVEEGMQAPEIDLVLDDGTTMPLSGMKGHPVVLYFYPKDDTPGCTKEAKDFTDQIGDFESAGAQVIGISPDSTASHNKFRTKHELGVKLASDEDKSIAEAFGVWVEKSMYGKTYMGVDRSTFLIDKTGRVAKCWRKVKVPGHVDAVLAAIKDLKD